MQTVKCLLLGDYDAGKTHLLMTYTCSPSLSYIHIIQNHSLTVLSRGNPVSLDLWDATSISDYDRLRPLYYPQTDVFLVCFSVVSPSSYDNVRLKIQNHSLTVLSRGNPVSLDLWDATSISDYDRLRPLYYPQTDVFLVCFSVVSPSSFDNVRLKWVPDVKRHCPDARFLLVGTRTDLRDDPQTLEKLSSQRQRPLSPGEGQELARRLRAVKYVECSAETKEGLKELFDEAILVALGERHGLQAENVPETDKSKKNCLLQ